MIKTKTKKLLMLFFIVFTIFSIFSIDAFAETVDCGMCGGSHDLSELGGLQKTTYNWYNTVYGGELFEQSENGKIGTYEVLQFDTSNSTFSSLWAKGREYYDALVVFGKMLVVIYVLVEILEKTTSDNFNAEHLVKCLIKLFVGVIVMDMGYDIVTAGMDFSSAVFGKVATAVGAGTSATGSCVFDALRDNGLFDALVKMAYILFPYLFMLAAKLIIGVICWARVLDIMVRVIFAPIGMADLIQEGTRGSGWKYLKKLVASGLQGAVIIGIIRCYGIITSAISSGGSNGGWAVTLMLAFVVITVAFKASSIANDIVGV